MGHGFFFESRWRETGKIQVHLWAVFFLSRRCLDLHFDVVCSLVLGKPAKVLQYLQSKGTLLERRALRKHDTGHHAPLRRPLRCCYFCGQSCLFCRVLVMEKCFFPKWGLSLPLAYFLLRPYRAVGEFSAVLGGVVGVLRATGRNAGPSSPSGQEERLKRTPAPLGPAQPRLQVGFKIR